MLSTNDKEQSIDATIIYMVNFYRIIHLITFISNNYTTIQQGLMMSEGEDNYSRWLNVIRGYMTENKEDYDDAELLEAINRCKPIIDYAAYDSTVVWPKLFERHPSSLKTCRGLKALSDTHNMPDSILKAYAGSMEVAAKASPIDFKKFRKWTKDKLVLDLGCGVGHLIQPMLEDGEASAVYGVDRQDILTFMDNQFIQKSEKVMISDDVTYEKMCLRLSQTNVGRASLPDVCFMGLVAHSKANPVEFIVKTRTSLMKPDETATIIMTFIKPTSFLQPANRLQIALHAGADPEKNMAEIWNWANSNASVLYADLINLNEDYEAVVIEMA